MLDSHKSSFWILGCFCALTLLSIPTHASDDVSSSEKKASPQALVLHSLIDQHDRIEEILSSLQPQIRFQSISVARKVDLQTYHAFVQGPVDLDGKRLVLLEDIPLSTLEAIPTTSAPSLLAALPAWIERGGHLLIVGGQLSVGGYAKSALEAVLPVVIKPDPEAEQFRKTQESTLQGMGSDGIVLQHLHPVERALGEIWIKAKDSPFVVHQKKGSGSVTIVLSGAYGQWLDDQPMPDKKDFFASEIWDAVLLRFFKIATGQTYALNLQEHDYDIRAYRYGSALALDALFPKQTTGTVTLLTEEGVVAQKTTVSSDAKGKFLLADFLRPGTYTLLLENGTERRTTKLRIGAPADPKRFEIRNFSLSNSPSPYSLSPGEAYRVASTLKSVGITSTVFAANPRRPNNDRRALDEIAAAGIDIIYYLSVRRNQSASLWTDHKLPLPLQASRPDGASAGWDIHDENFQRGIYLALYERKEDFALPGLRAMQVIEEFEDGGMDSPSLKKTIHEQGIRKHQNPQEAGWLPYQRLRSDATGKTFQYFRRATQQFVPGTAQAGYWPGSYWSATSIYTYRPQELANALDELLGPGYGYSAEKHDKQFGWLSVARSSAEIFSLFDYGKRPKTSTYIYAQGRRLFNDVDPDLSTWRETMWTALAHGATGLAYFALPPAEFLEPLRDLHSEVLEYGNWVGSLPRTPATVAVLTSWTTRTMGTPDQVKQHSECSAALFSALSMAIEKTDFLQEEQLAAPPQELKTIFLTETPFLTEESFLALTQFVEQGGAAFLDSISWAAQNPSSRASYADRWTKLSEQTQRVYSIPLLAGCTAARALRRPVAQYWAGRLQKEVSPESNVTENLDTEVWVRRNQDVAAAIGVNHDLNSQKITFQPAGDLQNFTWINLRTRQAISMTTGTEQTVLGRDAFTLLGVRKPAAKLSMKVYISPNRFVFRTCGIDANGKPLANGYPLGLRVVNEAGENQILPGNLARTAEDGCADWRIPISATDKSQYWDFKAFDPISNKVLGDRVTLPKYPPTL